MYGVAKPPNKLFGSHDFDFLYKPIVWCCTLTVRFRYIRLHVLLLPFDFTLILDLYQYWEFNDKWDFTIFPHFLGGRFFLADLYILHCAVGLYGSLSVLLSRDNNSISQWKAWALTALLRRALLVSILPHISEIIHNWLVIANVACKQTEGLCSGHWQVGQPTHCQCQVAFFRLLNLTFHVRRQKKRSIGLVVE